MTSAHQKWSARATSRADRRSRHLCARVSDEAWERGWDTSTARNQAHALKRARDAEQGNFRGQDLSAQKFLQSFGERYPRIEPDRIAWRIGHHAGRVFALREIRYDVAHEMAAAPLLAAIGGGL